MKKSALLTLGLMGFVTGSMLESKWLWILILIGSFLLLACVSKIYFSTDSSALFFFCFTLLAGVVYTSGYDQVFIKPKLFYLNHSFQAEGILYQEPETKTLQFYSYSPIQGTFPIKFNSVISHLSPHTSEWVSLKGFWKVPTSDAESIIQISRVIAVRSIGFFDVNEIQIKNPQTIRKKIFEAQVITGISLSQLPKKQLEQVLPSHEASLLDGILFGNTMGIKPEVQTGFTILGITHLLAASGANVAAFIWPIRITFRIMNQKKKIKSSKKLQMLMILTSVWMYAILAGLSISICRAALLITLYEIRPKRVSQVSFYRLLLATAWICLLLNPFWIYEISFQLSFSVTLGLATAARPLSQLISRLFPLLDSWTSIKAIFAGLIVAECVSAPLIAYYFNQWSLLSLISNLLLTPLIEVCIPIGVLFTFCCFLFGDKMTLLSAVMIQLLTSLERLASKVSMTPGYLYTVTVNFWQMMCFYFGLFILIFLNHIRIKSDLKIMMIRIRYICICFLILLVSLVGFHHEQPVFQMWLFSGGKEISTLIQMPTGEFILLNPGTEKNTPHLLKFLRKLGINQLNTVILTSPEPNEIEGTFPLMEQMKVGRIEYFSGNGWDELLFQQLNEIALHLSVPVIDLSQKPEIWHQDGVLVQELQTKDSINQTTANHGLNFILKYEHHLFFFGDLAVMLSEDQFDLKGNSFDVWIVPSEKKSVNDQQVWMTTLEERSILPKWTVVMTQSAKGLQAPVYNLNALGNLHFVISNSKLSWQ